MGVLAEHGRLALGAWSPGGSGAGFLATGTYSGTVDSSFSSSPVLELLSVDVQRSRLTTAAQFPTSDKFCSLHWGNPSRPHPAGLIAAGLADATVRVWDAASILRNPKPSDENHALVFSSDSNHHTANVKAIAFNPSVQHLLASGHSDGQILVWDLSNPAAVSPRHPANKPNPNTSSNDQVTALAWNQKVHNILSTSTTAGVMNVWDLKQSRQVISIRNPRGRLRCSSVAWHPDVATQIIITCDEDDQTGAVLWDLRNATAPVNTFSHHSPKGVVSASWSTHDTDLLLTSSKDMRTVVISVSSGDVVVDSPQAADWNFDVKWSPRVPGLYLASSLEGRLSVNSILVASSSPTVSSETANVLAESFGETPGEFQSGMATQSPRTTDSQRVVYNVRRPPKWMERPASVSFAFGGLVASVSTKQSVTVSIDITERGIPKAPNPLTKLDPILMDVKSEDPSPAIDWCKKQSEASTSQKDKMAWDILSILFQKDSRRKVVEYLGFKPSPRTIDGSDVSSIYGLLRSNPIAVPTKSLLPPSDVLESTRSLEENNEPEINGGTTKLEGPAPWELPEDGDGQALTKRSVLDHDDTEPSNVDNGKLESNDIICAGNGFDIAGKSKEDVDDVIRKLIVVGDFRNAVAVCLRVGRTADALLLSSAGGADLWHETQASYLATADLPFSMKAIGAVLGDQDSLDAHVSRLIDSGEVSWKEALAILLTYSACDKLSTACSQLGNQLSSKGNETGSVVCFLCAYDTDRIAASWMNLNLGKHKSTSGMLENRLRLLGDLVQRVRTITAAVLLAQGEREIGTVRALDNTSGSILCEFGALMVLQGEYALAVTYLGNLDKTHSCMYGTAEDLHAKASEFVTNLDPGLSASQESGQIAGDNPVVSQFNYYDGTSAASNQNNWMPVSQQAALPPPPPQMSTGYIQPPNLINTPTIPRSPYVSSHPTSASAVPQDNGSSAPLHSAPVVPPVPSISSHQVPAPSIAYATSSSAYATSSSAYATPSFQAPLTSGQQVNAGAGYPAPPPPTMFPNYSSINGNDGSRIPAPGIDHAYGTQVAPVAPSTGVGTMSTALPPPPPPSGEETALPKSYHLKAKQGSGAYLPPSSEVAVLKSREARETTGGMSKRTNSGTSLSSSGSDIALLDKIDVSKFGATETAIAQALRKIQANALGLNQSSMYRRKMDDINKRLGRLVADLGAGVIEMEIIKLLSDISKSAENGNYPEANAGVATLFKRFWAPNRRHWIQGLKWLFDCVQTGR